MNRFESGVAAFDAGRFFEAHEHWEELWLEAEGREKAFLQGLIQLAAAYHKGLVMGGARAMANLFEAALENLEAGARGEAVFMGVSVPPLSEACRRGAAIARDWAAGRVAGFPREAVIRLTAVP